MLTAPILIPQGLWARKAALRLPVASPPDSGCHGGDGGEFRVVGMGDSVIAGVGVDNLNESVTSQVAEQLSAEIGIAIGWQASGCNGERLKGFLARTQNSELSGADLVLVSIGVNDVTGLTGMARWQLQLIELFAQIRAHDRRIIVLGVPPMELFTALPQPLRWVLGLRAALLDHVLRQIVSVMPDVEWIDSASNFSVSQLAEDGYHPGREGCRAIAAQIVSKLNDGKVSVNSEPIA